MANFPGDDAEKLDVERTDVDRGAIVDDALILQNVCDCCGPGN